MSVGVGSERGITSLGSMSLNPSASEWTPNAGAPAFLPSGATPTAAAAEPAAAAAEEAEAVDAGKGSSENGGGDGEAGVGESGGAEGAGGDGAGGGEAGGEAEAGGAGEGGEAAGGGEGGAADGVDGGGGAEDEGGAAEGGADAEPVSAPPPTSDAVAAAEEAGGGAGASSGKKVHESRPEKHVNIVFIGHVDAGKSTISGHIMYATGMLDQRTLDKYEREAEANSRASWKYAWALDTTEQERDRGKTVEVGRASFVTGTKRFTILDAPGHKSFIPHMIGGASQADIGVLVVSARKNEFETGFDRGGQTREHAMLAKTAGVKQLIVAINKMDDETVEWSQKRYKEIVKKIKPYLKGVGYGKGDVVFMPISGLSGYNLKDPIPEGMCPWYTGPPLLTLLENLRPPKRLLDGAFRLPIADSYRDMGTVVMGKLESGTVSVGDALVMMPNRVDVEVTGMWIDQHEIEHGEPGDNLKIKLKGIDEGDVKNGFVLCQPDDLVSYVTEFEAQVMILEIPNILCAGYRCILHVHALTEEVEFFKLVAVVDRKSGDVIQAKPRFVKEGQTVLVRFRTEQPICVETYSDFAQLGRFMIRDEGKTVGVGIIKSLGPKKKKKKRRPAAAE